MIRMLETGWRDWPDPDAVYSLLAWVWRELSGATGEAGPWMLRPLTVVHGACPTGADEHTQHWALSQQAAGLPVIIERHPVTREDWRRIGKGAGPLRNQAMVNRGADICVGFPGPKRPDDKTSGTEDCMDRAHRAGIPVLTPAGVWPPPRPVSLTVGVRSC